MFQRLRQCPWRYSFNALGEEEISDHEPDSDKINGYGSAKGLLESRGKGEPGFVGALVEIVGKGDLLIIVTREQPNLLAGELSEGVMRSSSKLRSGSDP